MDAFASIRDEYMDAANGVPIVAATSLCLSLAANRPDDGPQIRQGWPLTIAAQQAVEVIATPGLDVDMVAALTASHCARNGLVVDDDRTTCACGHPFAKHGTKAGCRALIERKPWYHDESLRDTTRCPCKHNRKGA
jgi:hypothetical protein